MNKPTKYETPYSINLNNPEFRETVKALIDSYPNIKEVIETGTFNGLGSTKVFAETGKDVYTIECNYNNFVTATNNLRSYPNVCVIHGLSVDANYLAKNLLNDDFSLETTYDSKNPKPFYMREILQNNQQQNLLELLCDNHRCQLVFLDSAGGVGYYEFLKFMVIKEQHRRNKIIMLDDCDHIKHKRSVGLLLSNGYEVNISSDKRFAWCDLSTFEKNNSDVSENLFNNWMKN